MHFYPRMNKTFSCHQLVGGARGLEKRQLSLNLPTETLSVAYIMFPADDAIFPTLFPMTENCKISYHVYLFNLFVI